VAGIVMALSFAVLAIVPIVPLRELALMMTIGVVLDAFVVRSLLAPALVTAFGRFGGWPGSELAVDEDDVEPEPAAARGPIVIRPGA
jgi:RND superfamily putative drug exporter